MTLATRTYLLALIIIPGVAFCETNDVQTQDLARITPTIVRPVGEFEVDSDRVSFSSQTSAPIKAADGETAAVFAAERFEYDQDAEYYGDGSTQVKLVDNVDEWVSTEAVNPDVMGCDDLDIGCTSCGCNCQSSCECNSFYATFLTGVSLTRGE